MKGIGGIGFFTEYITEICINNIQLGEGRKRDDQARPWRVDNYKLNFRI